MSALQAGFEGVVPSADIPLAQQAQSLAPAAHSVVVHDVTPPTSPSQLPTTPTSPSQRPVVNRAHHSFSVLPPPRALGQLHPPATLKGIDADADLPGTAWDDACGEPDTVLELADGLALAGHSFGANKSVAGECVFQTGQLCRALCGWARSPSRRHGWLPRVAHGPLVFWSNFGSDLPSDW